MFSVVCVYNSKEKLEERLIPSLTSQSSEHQLILIDNRDAKFKNATDALNEGARKASGDWIAFVHQDVAFLSPGWLRDAESILERHQPDGWVGVIGWNDSEVVQGFVQDRDRLLGKPFDGLAEVQTMDECVLIHRRDTRAEPYFDPEIRGWHVYGVEACCRAIVNGQKNYVLGLPVWHDSATSNFGGLEEAHRYIWDKYHHAISPIYTTCGPLPETYGWGQTKSKEPGYFDKALYKILKELGISVTSHSFLGMALEDLTETYRSIDVIHPKAPTRELEVRAFSPQSLHPRRVTHRFTGPPEALEKSSCVVMMPEVIDTLSDDFPDLDELFPDNPAVFLCVPIKLRRLPEIIRAWRFLKAVNLAAHRTFDLEDQFRYVAVLGREGKNAHS